MTTTAAPLTRRSLLLSAPAALLALHAGCTKTAPSPEELEKRTAAIAASHDIQIGHGKPETFFVAPFTAKDAVPPGAKISPIAADVLPKALDGVELALKTYPKDFFTSVAKAIFLCDSISINDTPVAGYAGPAWMIIAAPLGQGEEAVAEIVRKGVHQQTGALAWRRSEALQARWRTLMPLDWQPAQTAAEALRAREKEDEALASGFLSSSASTSLEADFNSYAEAVFENPKRIVELARSNEKVRDKSALLMALYSVIDPRFKDTFKTLGLSEIPAAAPIVEKPPVGLDQKAPAKK